MASQGIQYDLFPYIPQLYLGGGLNLTMTHQTAKRYFIPVYPTLNHVKLNQYEMQCTIVLGAAKAPNGNPHARMRIGLYRCKNSSHDMELVSGSTYDTGDLTTALPLLSFPFTTVTMAQDPIIILGGSFFIVVQLEDSTAALSTSTVVVNIDGHTAGDTNLEQNFAVATVLAGALPATISGATLTGTTVMPYIGARWY